MENKDDKFIRLANARTRNAIHQIKLIKNLSNKKYYNYHSEDVKKIFKALKETLKDAERSFEEDKSVFKI